MSRRNLPSTGPWTARCWTLTNNKYRVRSLDTCTGHGSNSRSPCVVPHDQVSRLLPTGRVDVFWLGRKLEEIFDDCLTCRENTVNGMTGPKRCCPHLLRVASLRCDSNGRQRTLSVGMAFSCTVYNEATRRYLPLDLNARESALEYASKWVLLRDRTKQ